MKHRIACRDPVAWLVYLVLSITCLGIFSKPRLSPPANSSLACSRKSHGQIDNAPLWRNSRSTYCGLPPRSQRGFSILVAVFGTQRGQLLQYFLP